MYLNASHHPTTFSWFVRIWVGRGHGPLDFHAFNKESLTYNYWSLMVLKVGFKRGGGLLVGPYLRRWE